MVVANSTAASMGVKAGDVIASINQATFKTHEEVAAFARQLRVGDRLEIAVISNGIKSSRIGVAMGRPLETSDFAEVRYDAVDYELGTLRTIIHIPKGRIHSGKLPTIFYLQGYPCSAQEFLPDSKAAAKRAIDDWVKAGYVVFRVERPNLNDSLTTKDCRDTDFDEELSSNIAAYKKLLTYEFVDTRNVFLFGHSLGSVTAPMLAQVHQPKGIIAYGVVLRSWFEYFIDIHRVQSLHYGTSLVEAERTARALIPIYFEWLENNKSPQQLVQNPVFRELIESPDNPMGLAGDYAYGRHHRFWSTMNKKHLSEAWSKVNGKVLAMYGEFDVQAINEVDARNIAALVNENHPGNGKYLLLKNTEHSFLNASSYADSIKIAELRKNGKSNENDYNPEFGQQTVAWLNAVRDYQP